MPSILHLLETQFSVSMGRELTRAWLDERLGLLRKFTMRAVEAQTTDTFTWLLLCDENTDAAILEELREEERRLPCLRIALTSDQRTPLDVLRGEVQPETDVLITTRLDSDDMIADGYVRAIQDYAGSFHRSSYEALLVNFPHGYRLDVREGKLFEDWMPNSSFHSLFERPTMGPPQTVRNVNAAHIRLHHHYPTQQDESMPAWLIVVHGGNLINCVDPDDRELPRGSLPAGFSLQA